MTRPSKPMPLRRRSRMMTGESDAGRSTGSKPETAMWPIIMLSTE